ncbi:SMI1/KNR4 family protein [Nonomuraea sp. NPDC049655]|uniref:SMI1/KNR4 family protein n=1 Tax=Nonomuraea sp. NPDC049655 TaxID=3364355 RepID=UPI0037B5B23A
MSAPADTVACHEPPVRLVRPLRGEGPDPRSPEGPPPAPGNGLHPPAGEAEVSRLEDRLGTALPPSYRQFLLFADGWGDDESGHVVLPAARVGWFRDLAPWLPGADRHRSFWDLMRTQ